jgi:uroporphyrinogen-III synthase
MATPISPLYNKRILVTRALHQTAELETLLRERGAVALSYPCIAIEPPDNTQALDGILQTQKFDWAIFTSANAVYSVAQRLNSLQLALDTRYISAIGDKTAESVRQYLHREATCEAWDSSSEGVMALMRERLNEGERVFLPQSDLADHHLAHELSQLTPHITHSVAYRTTIGTGGVALLPLLQTQALDVITLTSPSTLTNFLLRLGNEGGTITDLRTVAIACIGTITAQHAQEHGLTVAIIPPKRNMPHLVQALEAYFARLAV